jgi:hypothetical protein
VLHHRNNEERFQQDRLKWTAKVPNSFYVFSIEDPNGKSLIKFGRTQHEDVLKRYPAKELKDFKMKLLLKLRGRLDTMTRIENWWKTESEEKGYFCKFSEADFHGKDETLEIDAGTLKKMIDQSNKMAQADLTKSS